MIDFNPIYDCIVGIFYGTPVSLGPAYRKIEKEYSVIIGKEFWQILTGNENFYQELINALAEVLVIV